MTPTVTDAEGIGHLHGTDWWWYYLWLRVLTGARTYRRNWWMEQLQCHFGDKCMQVRENDYTRVVELDIVYFWLSRHPHYAINVNCTFLMFRWMNWLSIGKFSSNTSDNSLPVASAILHAEADVLLAINVIAACRRRYNCVIYVDLKFPCLYYI